jgi:hypothetical protein
MLVRYLQCGAGMSTIDSLLCFVVVQVCWAPDGSGVVYTAWPTAPRTLGLTHYNSRASKIYLTALRGVTPDPTAAPVLLTPDDHSAMSVVDRFRRRLDVD